MFLLQRCMRSFLTILLMMTGLLCYAQVVQGTGDKPNASEVDASAVVPTAYKIGVGDVLHITVWEEPQFTEVAVVRPDGKVFMPLVSEVKVAGLTPESAQQLYEAYAVNPSVLFRGGARPERWHSGAYSISGHGRCWRSSLFSSCCRYTRKLEWNSRCRSSHEAVLSWHVRGGQLALQSGAGLFARD